MKKGDWWERSVESYEDSFVEKDGEGLSGGRDKWIDWGDVLRVIWTERSDGFVWGWWGTGRVRLTPRFLSGGAAIVWNEPDVGNGIAGRIMSASLDMDLQARV